MGVSWAFNFADVAGYLWEKRRESFMGCERSFIPVKFIRLRYLVLVLSNPTIKLCIKTGLILTRREYAQHLQCKREPFKFAQWWVKLLNKAGDWTGATPSQSPGWSVFLCFFFLGIRWHYLHIHENSNVILFGMEQVDFSYVWQCTMRWNISMYIFWRQWIAGNILPDLSLHHAWSSWFLMTLLDRKQRYLWLLVPW